MGKATSIEELTMGFSEDIICVVPNLKTEKALGGKSKNNEDFKSIRVGGGKIILTPGDCVIFLPSIDFLPDRFVCEMFSLQHFP